MEQQLADALGIDLETLKVALVANNLAVAQGDPTGPLPPDPTHPHP